MNTITEVDTLKITFSDGTETNLPRWFTNQFDYFKNIIEDLGEEMEDNNGNEYKYLELDFAKGGMGSEIGSLLTKPILAFLKRLAYHIEFIADDDFDEEEKTSKTNSNSSEWNTPDGYQTKIITRLIKENKWNELFKIYFVTDYLGNSKICHAITDVVLKYLSDSNLIDVEKLQEKFNLKSQFTPSQQKDILSKFDWRE